MSLPTITAWVLIYFITAVVFIAAGFGYFSGWWDDASIVAIVLMTLVGFLAGRLTKTEYFIRRLIAAVDAVNSGGRRSSLNKPDNDTEESQENYGTPQENEEYSVFRKVAGEIGKNSGYDRSGFAHDRRYLRRLRNAVYSLSEVDRGDCKCWKCGSVSRHLRHFPHDPAFHRDGCPVPGARLLVAPIDIAEDIVAVKN
jgi:hypothetical protein